MRLVWKEYDYFHPMFNILGIEFLGAGLYGAGYIGYRALVVGWPNGIFLLPLWLIPALLAACGVVLLIHQWKKRAH
jgi:hypothetical protein